MSKQRFVEKYEDIFIELRLCLMDYVKDFDVFVESVVSTSFLGATIIKYVTRFSL